MATDKALIEKREELKRRLAAGEYKTLVDVFLEWFDRLIRKITRQSKPLPIWLVIIVLTLVYYLSIYAISIIEGTADILLTLVGTAGPAFLFVLFVVPVFFITSLIVINQYIHKLFKVWHDTILDAIESVSNLDEFENWLQKTCNWKLHLLVTIGGGLLGGFYMTSLTSNLTGEFMGYWYELGSIFLFFYFYALVYLVLLVVILSANLRQYQLNLFAADPSSSEIIALLSGAFSSMVYFFSVIAAFTTLASAFVGLLLPLGIVLVFVLWLPIIALFILNQTGLSNIIRRTKWRTLNEIQDKVEKLQISKNFGNQETMDAIKRLMDYHDRVKATRDSALDFRAYLNFFNSLLLPLLAFILGNLDLVMNLFAGQP